MQGDLAKSVMLRDGYKNLWSVEVARNGDKWYFKKGWAQFYEENSLELGNFLVFEYKGDNLFDFKLLGHDACEKKGVGGALKFRVKEEELYEDNDTFVVSEEHDDHHDDDYVQGEKDEEEDEELADTDESDENYEDEEEQVNISKKIKAKPKSKSSCALGRNSSKDRTCILDFLSFPNVLIQYVPEILNYIKWFSSPR